MCALAGPLRLDPQHAARVEDTSIRRYRRAVNPFCRWLAKYGFDPCGADEWDDLLVEYKNYPHDVALKKHAFEELVAAVEFFFARFRGKLLWSKSVIRGWGIEHVVRHTVPLGEAPAALVATHLCAMGFPRLAAGCVLQQSRGLRPSEMLQLEGRDLTPSTVAQSTSSCGRFITVRLGIRSGTKAKRQQFVILCESTHPVIFHIILTLLRCTGQDQLMFPHTLAFYNHLLKTIEGRLGIKAGWTPHSARAGYATEAIAKGVTFLEVKETGRWLSDSSLRVYIDIIGASTIAHTLQQAGLEPALVFALAHLGLFFSDAIFNATPGVGEGRWAVSRTAGPQEIPDTSIEPGTQGVGGVGDSGESRILGLRGRGRGRGRGNSSSPSAEQTRAYATAVDDADDADATVEEDLARAVELSPVAPSAERRLHHCGGTLHCVPRGGRGRHSVAGRSAGGRSGGRLVRTGQCVDISSDSDLDG